MCDGEKERQRESERDLQLLLPLYEKVHHKPGVQQQHATALHRLR